MFISVLVFLFLSLLKLSISNIGVILLISFCILSIMFNIHFIYNRYFKNRKVVKSLKLENCDEIINTSLFGIVFINSNGDIVKANQTFKNIVNNNFILGFNFRKLKLFKHLNITLREGVNLNEELVYEGEFFEVDVFYSTPHNSYVIFLKNLTDLKKVEFHLKKSQEYGKIGSWEVNLSNNHIFWSDGMFNVFDNVDGVIKKPKDFYKFIFKEDVRDYKLAVRECIKTGTPLSHIFRTVTKSGIKIIWVKSHIEKRGDQTILSGINQDITEISQIKEELRLKDKKYKNFFNYTPYALILIDKDDNIIEINKKALDVYKIEDIEKLNTFSRFKHQVKDNTVFHKTWRGDVFPVTIKDIQFSYKNETFDLLAIEDIKEKLHIDKKLIRTKNKYANLYNLLKTISNTIPDFMWAKDLSGRYIFANDEVCKKILNVDNSDYVLGHEDSFFIENIKKEYANHDFGVLCPNSDKDVISSKKRGVFHEYGNALNQWLDLEVHKAPLYNKNGDLTGVVSIGRNITERIKMEKKLQDSLVSYKSIFDTSTNAIYILDLKFRFITVNKGAEKMYGREKEYFIGKTPLDLCDTEHTNVKNVFEKMNKCLLNKTSQNFEFWAFNKAGESFSKNVQIYRADYFGKDVIIATAQNISELKLAQKRLEESKQNYQNLLANAPLGIVYFDVNGNIEYLNPELIKILKSSHLKTEEDYKKNINLLKSEILKELGIPDIVKESLNNRKSEYSEGIYENRGGKTIYYRFYCNPLIRDGKVYGGIAMLEDFTERHKMELALENERNLIKRLFEVTPECIYIKDIDGNFKLVNQSQTKLLGITSPDDAIGKSEADFFKNSKFLKKDDAHVIASGEEILNKEEFIQTFDNKTSQWVSTTKIPLKDSNDKTIGLVGVSHNITNRRKIFKDLEKSNQILKNFAYTTSHDLKTPLRGMSSFIEKVRRELIRLAIGEDEKIFKYIDLVIKSADQMNKIIIDTLSYAKISKEEIVFEKVNLFDIARKSAFDFSQIRKKNVKLIIDIEKTIEINADKNQMIRVFTNLISNGIKFNESKNKQISITCTKSNKVGFKYLIKIADNGVGIDPAYKDKIFDLFHRLHSSKVEGNGLGLAIVKIIIEKHRGVIEVDSILNKGCTFNIYI